MGFLRDYKRKRILEQPYPDEWDQIVERRVAHWRYLDGDERARLRRLVQVFVAEVRWQGCAGLELTDDAKVTIAAQACILILGLDGIDFKNVSEVLVYPTTIKTPAEPHAQFGMVVESGSQFIELMCCTFVYALTPGFRPRFVNFFLR